MQHYENDGTPFKRCYSYITANLNAKRDWGHAKDYVRGMWLMLQQKKPEDMVLATGETTRVRAFYEMAFAHPGINLK